MQMLWYVSVKCHQKMVETESGSLLYTLKKMENSPLYTITAPAFELCFV